MMSVFPGGVSICNICFSSCNDYSISGLCILAPNVDVLQPRILLYAAMHVPIHRRKAEERLLSLSMSLLGRQRMLEKTDGLKLGSDPRDLCHLPNAYPALTYNPIDPVGCIEPMLKQRICV